ncbi:hypothetical protein GCM10020360_30370 [Nonlabens tegetincola]
MFLGLGLGAALGLGLGLGAALGLGLGLRSIRPLRSQGRSPRLGPYLGQIAYLPQGRRRAGCATWVDRRAFAT